MPSKKSHSFRNFSDKNLRAQWWDYRRAAAYFVTINTRKRVPYFGKLKDGKMILSPTGVVADLIWHYIPYHATEVALGPFVVMPDHIHGIVEIGVTSDGSVPSSAPGNPPAGHNPEAIRPQPSGQPNSRDQPTPHRPPKDQNVRDFLGFQDSRDSDDRPYPRRPSKSPGFKDTTMATKSPQAKSLSAVIRNYKAGVTRHANRLGLPNGWQSRFHDRIIRDEQAYLDIARYIRDNPLNG